MLGNVNEDFKRGAWTAAGVIVAIYVIGLITGAFKRVF
jgi:hypothetical protein